MSYDIWGVYRPKLSIYAWHGKTKHSLTGNVLQCTTHKSVDEPAGQFTILMTYQTHWEFILAPMDYVEIRMSRYSDSPKMIMRGFISSIRRTRTIGSDGKRIRTLTISGNDYGKLLQQYQIYYAANDPGQQGAAQDNDPAQGLLVPQLFENFGLFGNGSNQQIALKDFLPTLINGSSKSPGLIASWIKALKKTTPSIPDLKVSSSTLLSDYQLMWLSLQSVQGSLADVINQYGNLPWCEWFVYDTEEAPYIIHRNTPFKDSSGKYVFSESALSSEWTNTIYDYDVIEEDVGLSDSEVYDYFFTWPSNFSNGDLFYKYDIIGAQNLTSSEENSSTFSSNPKVNESAIYKYGLNIMEQASPAIPVLDPSTSSMDPMSVELSIKMNMWLYHAYGWGATQLNGTINLKGNETVRIGNYLFNKDSNEEYYIESVDHTFTVSQIDSLGNDGSFSFTTSVGVTRGHYTHDGKADSGSESASSTSSPSLTSSAKNTTPSIKPVVPKKTPTGGSFGGNGSGGGNLGPPPSTPAPSSNGFGGNGSGGGSLGPPGS